MTLIEVVAGLALLAGVLGGILTVKARVARQSREVAQRQRAISAADAMLRDWFVEPAKFPKLARGLVPGQPELAWRTFPVRNPQAEALGGQVIRFEIPSDPAGDRPPLVAVEVVVPSEAKHDAGVHAH
jgi:type II secretory pathway pseudopilin PulG